MRSGIAGVVLAALAMSAGGAAAQDAKVEHHKEFRRCRPCLQALATSMAYLKENWDSPKVKRVIGSRLGGTMYAGLAFLMAGEGYERELQACVRWCCQAVTDEGFNRNWYLAGCLYFLSEVATRRGLTPQIRKAMDAGLRMARDQQEATGGWCHHREMWKEDGYNTKGGGRDLGMVTVQLYAAFLEMKALGVDPGPLLDTARKNLESIRDGAGGGICYGTDNRVGDPAFARASYVLLGLRAAGATDDPFHEAFAEGVKAGHAKIERGEHGFAPFHYFSVAAAMHRLGPEAYATFCGTWLDRLMATQRPDGVVPLKGEDDVASTGVFACILLMQREGAFQPPPRRRPRR